MDNPIVIAIIAIIIGAIIGYIIAKTLEKNNASKLIKSAKKSAASIIKEANHEAIYLGQSVPYSDVLAIAASKRFDFILVSSSATRAGFDLDLYLKELDVAFPDKKILYCSSHRGEPSKKTSTNLIPINHVEDLTDFIEQIS